MNFALGRKDPLREGFDSRQGDSYSQSRPAHRATASLGVPVSVQAEGTQPARQASRGSQPLDSPGKKRSRLLPVQRKALRQEDAVYDTSSVSDVLNRSEPALSTHRQRRSMETRFGYDFSKVRIHTDSEAAQSARSVGAHAYTVQKNVVFGSGKYAPDTAAGRRLLAHELTHVVQQNRDIVRKPRSNPRDYSASRASADSTRRRLRQLVLQPHRKGKRLHPQGPGFKLFSLIIGKDPLTGEKKECNAENLPPPSST